MNENPFTDDVPTKTDETIEFYLKRAENFKKRCAKLLNKSVVDVNSFDLAKSLSELAPTLNRSSVRLYKAFIRYYIEQNPDEYDGMAFDVIDNIIASESPKRTNRTSGLRGKSISERTFAAVIYALSLPNFRSKWAHLTSLWLQAGALTGLRPHEWQNAQIVTFDGRICLEILNGKQTNNRSHGEFRHLDISDIAPHEKRVIEQFLLLIEPYCYTDEEFKTLQQNCMQTLQRLNRLIEKGGVFTKEQGLSARKGSGIYYHNNKGKRVQLYTGRHRFSSVMKKVSELAEVAAMMGHKTDKTATLHYGRTDVHHAGGTRRPRPVAEEVAKVERKHSLNQKIKQTTPTPTPAPTTTPSPKPISPSFKI